MAGANDTVFNMAKLNKTDDHQKWQWNSRDESLHTWIDTSLYIPAVKYSNSVCENAGSIAANLKQDATTTPGEAKWHTVTSCNHLCHSKTWCTEFTHWK